MPTSLTDCSNCVPVYYYDCTNTIYSSNHIKKNGYRYTEQPTNPVLSCCSGCPIDLEKQHTQKKIQNTVKIPTGQYLDNLTSLTVRGDSNNTPLSNLNNVNESQASDRNRLHIQTAVYNKPRFYSARPGRQGPGGKGVDVKHNSFDRILARKKAQHLRTENITYDASLVQKGNKVKKYGIVDQDDYKCSNSFKLGFY